MYLLEVCSENVLLLAVSFTSTNIQIHQVIFYTQDSSKQALLHRDHGWFAPSKPVNVLSEKG